MGALVVFGGAVVALGGVVGVFGGLVGGLVVAGAPLGAPRGPRLDPDGVPVVLDLVAGCLVAGIGLPAALDAAAAAADEVLAGACFGVARGLRAGLTAEEAWAPWLADPWLEPVARTAVRTAQSGAAAADELRRTASRLRARRRAAAQHRVQRASVWLVIPLGLCFLPAFVLVAVVPLVVGLLPALR